MHQTLAWECMSRPCNKFMSNYNSPWILVSCLGFYGKQGHLVNDLDHFLIDNFVHLVMNICKSFSWVLMDFINDYITMVNRNHIPWRVMDVEMFFLISLWIFSCPIPSNNYVNLTFNGLERIRDQWIS